MNSLGDLIDEIRARLRRGNLALVMFLSGGLALGMIVINVLFHYFMRREGQHDHSWIDGLYWAFVTMSTLGYGDITFESDAGRIYSSIVLLTGVLIILAVLPTVLIRFVFTPWMKRREASRAPRKLPDWISGHIILTALDDVTASLIELAELEDVPYVIVVDDLREALRLHDRGYEVLHGFADDPKTYRNARADKASVVITTQHDTTNANVAFTVREIAPDIRILATANNPASVDILELSGCDEVFQLGKLLGQAIASRVSGVDTRTHVIGRFGNLLIAEANVAGTDLIGRPLSETYLGTPAAVNVIGMRSKGKYSPVTPDTVLDARSILLVSGSAWQLTKYDEKLADERPREKPVLILGGGRVGRSAARSLATSGIESVIVEKRRDRIKPDLNYVEGDAAKLEILEDAGLQQAATALVTTHDDDINVYLTIYLRRLRPDIQIVARASRERNVSTLHRAGADSVLSYSSIGSAAMWNALGWRRRLIIAEGVEVSPAPVPRGLKGRSINEAKLESKADCRVVALNVDGKFEHPDPDEPLPADAELLIVGDENSERRFMETFANWRQALLWWMHERKIAARRRADSLDEEAALRYRPGRSRNEDEADVVDD